MNTARLNFMRNLRWVTLASLLGSFVMMTNCISVNFKPASTQRKPAAVKYTEPSNPFIVFPSQNVDNAWKNPQTGNIISYLSDCDDISDVPLTSVVQNILAGIESAQTLERREFIFNKRQAVRTVIKGSVDGVESKIVLIVVKKNNCTYALTYISTEDRFEVDLGEFNNFLTRFEVP